MRVTVIYKLFEPKGQLLITHALPGEVLFFGFAQTFFATEKSPTQ